MQPLLNSLLLFLLGAATIGIGLCCYLLLRRRGRGTPQDGVRRQHHVDLLQATLGMTRIRSTRRLERLIVGVVTRIARVRSAALFVKDRRRNRYQLASARHCAQWPIGMEQLPNEGYIVRLLLESREPIVVEPHRLRGHGFNQRPQAGEQLALQLRQLGIHLIVPSFLEAEMIGFLTLGPLRSAESYARADLQMFSALAAQCGLAFENAASFEELQQTQSQLFQAQQLGTLGQMASGMSHQIHNRFNVLSLAAQSARITALPKLERLLSSAGQIPDEIRAVLNDLDHFYEVIESETERGAKIVRGLQSYAKPSDQTEIFALQEVMAKAIDLLAYKIQHEPTIQMEQEYPQHLPTIRGYQSQVRDVFFNLLDNACDAIVGKHQELSRQSAQHRRTEYKGVVRIHATVVHTPCAVLQVTIADNGLGMTESEQEQLFVPFFTSKATAVKGGGLGLFVIRKIIEAHGGHVRAFSRLGQGSTFIVELPVITNEPETP